MQTTSRSDFVEEEEMAGQRGKAEPTCTAWVHLMLHIVEGVREWLGGWVGGGAYSVNLTHVKLSQSLRL